MILHVITKVSLVITLKMALFALKCIDMVVNDEDNDLTC